MLSHDLAKLLLAHRNNDVRVEVLVDDDPTGETDLLAMVTDLRDYEPSNGSTTIPVEDIVIYDTDDDVVVIRAGTISIGATPERDATKTEHPQRR